MVSATLDEGPDEGPDEDQDLAVDPFFVTPHRQGIELFVTCDRPIYFWRHLPPLRRRYVVYQISTSSSTSRLDREFNAEDDVDKHNNSRSCNAKYNYYKYSLGEGRKSLSDQSVFTEKFHNESVFTENRLPRTPRIKVSSHSPRGKVSSPRSLKMNNSGLKIRWASVCELESLDLSENGSFDIALTEEQLRNSGKVRQNLDDDRVDDNSSRLPSVSSSRSERSRATSVSSRGSVTSSPRVLSRTSDNKRVDETSASEASSLGSSSQHSSVHASSDIPSTSGQPSQSNTGHKCKNTTSLNSSRYKCKNSSTTSYVQDGHMTSRSEEMKSSPKIVTSNKQLRFSDSNIFVNESSQFVNESSQFVNESSLLDTKQRLRNLELDLLARETEAQILAVEHMLDSSDSEVEDLVAEVTSSSSDLDDENPAMEELDFRTRSSSSHDDDKRQCSTSFLRDGQSISCNSMHLPDAGCFGGGEFHHSFSSSDEQELLKITLGSSGRLPFLEDLPEAANESPRELVSMSSRTSVENLSNSAENLPNSTENLPNSAENLPRTVKNLSSSSKNSRVLKSSRSLESLASRPGPQAKEANLGSCHDISSKNGTQLRDLVPFVPKSQIPVDEGGDAGPYGCVITLESRSASVDDLGPASALEEALVSLTSNGECDGLPLIFLDSTFCSGPNSLTGNDNESRDMNDNNERVAIDDIGTCDMNDTAQSTSKGRDTNSESDYSRKSVATDGTSCDASMISNGEEVIAAQKSGSQTPVNVTDKSEVEGTSLAYDASTSESDQPKEPYSDHPEASSEVNGSTECRNRDQRSKASNYVNGETINNPVNPNLIKHNVYIREDHLQFSKQISLPERPEKCRPLIVVPSSAGSWRVFSSNNQTGVMASPGGNISPVVNIEEPPKPDAYGEITINGRSIHDAAMAHNAEICSLDVRFDPNDFMSSSPKEKENQVLSRKNHSSQNPRLVLREVVEARTQDYIVAETSEPEELSNCEVRNYSSQAKNQELRCKFDQPWLAKDQGLSKIEAKTPEFLSNSEIEDRNFDYESQCSEKGQFHIDIRGFNSDDSACEEHAKGNPAPVREHSRICLDLELKKRVAKTSDQDSSKCGVCLGLEGSGSRTLGKQVCECDSKYRRSQRSSSHKKNEKTCSSHAQPRSMHEKKGSSHAQSRSNHEKPCSSHVKSRCKCHKKMSQTSDRGSVLDVSRSLQSLYDCPETPSNERHPASSLGRSAPDKLSKSAKRSSISENNLSVANKSKYSKRYPIEGSRLSDTACEISSLFSGGTEGKCEQTIESDAEMTYDSRNAESSCQNSDSVEETGNQPRCSACSHELRNDKSRGIVSESENSENQEKCKPGCLTCFHKRRKRETKNKATETESIFRLDGVSVLGTVTQVNMISRDVQCNLCNGPYFYSGTRTNKPAVCNKLGKMAIRRPKTAKVFGRYDVNKNQNSGSSSVYNSGSTTTDHGRTVRRYSGSGSITEPVRRGSGSETSCITSHSDSSCKRSREYTSQESESSDDGSRKNSSRSNGEYSESRSVSSIGSKDASPQPSKRISVMSKSEKSERRLTENFPKAAKEIDEHSLRHKTKPSKAAVGDRKSVGPLSSGTKCSLACHHTCECVITSCRCLHTSCVCRANQYRISTCECGSVPVDSRILQRSCTSRGSQTMFDNHDNVGTCDKEIHVDLPILNDSTTQTDIDRSFSVLPDKFSVSFNSKTSSGPEELAGTTVPNTGAAIPEAGSYLPENVFNYSVAAESDAQDLKEHLVRLGQHFRELEKVEETLQVHQYVDRFDSSDSSRLYNFNESQRSSVKMPTTASLPGSPLASRGKIFNSGDASFGGSLSSLKGVIPPFLPESTHVFPSDYVGNKLYTPSVSSTSSTLSPLKPQHSGRDGIRQNTQGPPRTINNPPKINSKPLGLNNRPLRTESNPHRTESNPLRILSNPLRTESNPFRIPSSPHRTESNPLRRNNSPLRTEIYPLRLSSSPLSTESNPLTIINNPLKITKDPHKANQNPPRMPNSLATVGLTQRSVASVECETLIPLSANNVSSSLYEERALYPSYVRKVTSYDPYTSRVYRHQGVVTEDFPPYHTNTNLTLNRTYSLDQSRFPLDPSRISLDPNRAPRDPSRISLDPNRISLDPSGVPKSFKESYSSRIPIGSRQNSYMIDTQKGNIFTEFDKNVKNLENDVRNENFTKKLNFDFLDPRSKNYYEDLADYNSLKDHSHRNYFRNLFYLNYFKDQSYRAYSKHNLSQRNLDSSSLNFQPKLRSYSSLKDLYRKFDRTSTSPSGHRSRILYKGRRPSDYSSPMLRNRVWSSLGDLGLPPPTHPPPSDTTSSVTWSATDEDVTSTDGLLGQATSSARRRRL